ncbi:hypothetical protein K1Y80_02145 [Streptomyces sp. MAG02]|nr:hypothetical protein [Streptomyces sp. MAG02]
MSAADDVREAIAVGCTRDDHDHVQSHRDEVLGEAASAVLAWRLPHPVDEAEEHMNDVLVRLADKIRTLPQGGAR